MARFRDPGVRMITVTVSEKGYLCAPGSAALDMGSAEVLADLAAPDAPCTMPGLLAAGLDARRRAGAGPVTVVSCDNLRGNGRVLRSVVLDARGPFLPRPRPLDRGACAFPLEHGGRHRPEGARRGPAGAHGTDRHRRPRDGRRRGLQALGDRGRFRGRPPAARRGGRRIRARRCALRGDEAPPPQRAAFGAGLPRAQCRVRLRARGDGRSRASRASSAG